MNYLDNHKERQRVSKELRAAEKDLAEYRWSIRPLKDAASGFATDLDRTLYIDKMTAEKQANVDKLRDELERLNDYAKWILRTEPPF